ncbi:MAG: membrane protein insertase YidC [Candidatus Coatesbacteria bacterium]|nr:membrane protein insertase YidC [Candidatus Coatesbacteria bacterium]
MNKNSILAFVIIFALILIWSYFGGLNITGKPQSPAQKKTVVADEKESKKSEAKKEEIKKEKKTELVEADTSKAINKKKAVTEEIEVKTDLWTAVLSNKGGIIYSYKLNKYKVADKDIPVELRGNIAIVSKKGDENDKETVYEISREGDIEKDHLKITFTDSQRNIQKIYTFYRGKYHFSLEIKAPAEYEYQVLNRGSMDFAEKMHDQEIQNTYFYSYYQAGNYDYFSLSDFKKKYQEEFNQLKWLAFRTKYFLTVMEVSHTQNLPGSVSVREADLSPITNNDELAKIAQSVLTPYTLGFVASGVSQFKIFMGPADYNLLKKDYGEWYKVIDFGWPVIRNISPYLLKFMEFLYSFIPHYGWVIIIFSILMKFAFYPLTHKSMKSMAQMKEVQPKIDALKERYKNDPKKMQEETFKLYKEHGFNPMGGCLPLFVQMPVFFALYRVLSSSIELRQAGFLWIKDLSSPDILFNFGVTLPLVGSEFHLLPLLMGLTMFWQQKMTITDPKQKMMVYFMPVFMTFIFYSIPSGLVLYWFVNSILSLGEQYISEWRKKNKVEENEMNQ